MAPADVQLGKKTDLDQLALDMAGKVDKVTGKGLSTNDYTTAEKDKLAGVATGATKTTVNNTLTSTSTTDALSAAQGKVLQDNKAAKADAVTEVEGTMAAGGTGNAFTLKQTKNGAVTTVGSIPFAEIIDNVGYAGIMTGPQVKKLGGVADGATKTTINNTLTSTSATEALSAGMGKKLQDEKAASNHNHDSVYASKTHNHSTGSNVVDYIAVIPSGGSTSGLPNNTLIFEI